MTDKHCAGEYEVIGKAVVESGGGHVSWTLKLLLRGSSPLPWWTASAGLEWPTTEAFFNAAKVGDRLTLTATKGRAI